MKFKYKIQEFQTDAVNSVIDVFMGQPKCEMTTFRYYASKKVQPSLLVADPYGPNDEGYENAQIVLPDLDLLHNIQSVQRKNNIVVQDNLVNDLGRCCLNIEMETGTGKTYVYIKTIFELNKEYGWSKFIVVVPSIAIREGAYKSFKMTEDHFMEQYGKKIRYFIYDSKNLTRLDSFASGNDIEVMIINIQAFNARGEDARRINIEQDEFQSRRPIDVIAQARPILILDEPQKLGGGATQEGLKKFKPLFSLNYSATHKKQNNLVYVLDAVDAYNEKLVKKIEVKGIEVKNLRGIDSYLYLEDIVLSKDKPPRARLEFEINYNASINRETRILDVGDSLYAISKEMPQYNGYTISDIDPYSSVVTFTNGVTIAIGEAQGDVSIDHLRRIQIKETIKSHFEKEEELFRKGIKCLSLFFIDEVAKYRDYSKDDTKGEYAKIFEEEYKLALKNVLENENITSEYRNYLNKFQAEQVHNGYFSIDKKTNHFIDSSVGRSKDESDDISAYDLILKDKERLLSFDEPTRFIFSHSALREGWDNPNIFQICTLRHSNSNIARRQEVGRGLRLAVDSEGDRVDSTYPGVGDNVHHINLLTVVATDKYADFVDGLQKEISEDLYNRPIKLTVDYFIDKELTNGDETKKISDFDASVIYTYLLTNHYVDLETGQLTDKYYSDKESNTFAEMTKFDELENYSDSIHLLIQRFFGSSTMTDMISNASKPVIRNELNKSNFDKKEFQALWHKINHKYTYMVDFDSNELIKHAIDDINRRLNVTISQYVVTRGAQKVKLSQGEYEKKEVFETKGTTSGQLDSSEESDIKYDLVGDVAKNTTLTRKTIVQILQGINVDKLKQFAQNPEDFIKKVSNIINDAKATLIVEHVSYNMIDEEFDSDVFTNGEQRIDLKRAFESQKSVANYVLTDGIAEDSVEKRFADDLEKADEVVVYAKLLKGFYIPTPMGNHTPDWAIAFKEGSVKHVYFIAETKGTSGLDSLELRAVEKAKTECAKKLFDNISTKDVKYGIVNSYSDLLSLVRSDNL